MSRLKLTIPNKEKEQYNRIIDAMAGKLSELLGHNEMESFMMELGMNEMARGQYDTEDSQPIHDALTIMSQNLI